ncbi:MAG: HEAT repeat domain-containing protein [Anaerolineae bacterium]|nr:HEAT repeat domain-containing protein [Anaerolineae bacterium]
MHAYLAEQPDLLAAIEADADLKAMLSTPLIMSLFAFAYKDLTPEDAVHLRDLAASPGDLRDAIIKRYVRERYAWEDRKHGPLAFSLDEIDEVLGRAAMENVIGGWWVEENVLHSRILGLDVGCLSVFTTLAVQLNLLAPERYNYWRFVHLLLRDYFAFGYALPHLHDAHRSARRSAAKALGQLGDARAVAPLIAALRDDVDAVVRLTVPIALMRIGTPEALVAIVRCGSWGDSIRAVHKLECIGEPSVAGLIAVLRVAKERLIRLAAAEALEKIGTPEALAAVNAFRRGEIKPDTE